MSEQNAILAMIESRSLYSKPVTHETDLYLDLGFDSLTFTGLLVEIENTFSISFDIAEIQKCLKAGALICLVNDKLAHGGRSHD